MQTHKYYFLINLIKIFKTYQTKKKKFIFSVIAFLTITFSSTLAFSSGNLLIHGQSNDEFKFQNLLTSLASWTVICCICSENFRSAQEISIQTWPTTIGFLSICKFSFLVNYHEIHVGFWAIYIHKYIYVCILLLVKACCTPSLHAQVMISTTNSIPCSYVFIKLFKDGYGQMVSTS